MNPKTQVTVLVSVGVVIAALSGSAISRSAGFADSGWLMGAFACGILLMSHAPVLLLQHQVRELQRKLATEGRA